MKLEIRKFSIFQIVSIILIAVLVIAIIVQIGIIIHLKLKTKDLEDKNDKLTTSENEKAVLQPWQDEILKEIESI